LCHDPIRGLFTGCGVVVSGGALEIGRAST
jgi:hypothetical protein